ncbi:iron-containing alcohol dehydrogenase [Spiribacter vilamensis]|uniref:Alcohol dehydrogenase class IV n=1 Tax=Spiribacter vilamensis TaxID=531306 RepID=A0A4Q8CZC0_9GAMM|nr:iron-containing alcohol dehydrogenase [Spiribacter vilamensis]RZU98260.1 alcohol dehydrogenase class IV [Spiribacter vilamensis]
MTALDLDSPATPRIVAGVDALQRLTEVLPATPAPVIVIADAGMESAGLVDRLETALPPGRPCHRFICPHGEPTLATINAGAGYARELRDAVIVGLGGGSALDSAKLVASLAATALPAEDFVLGRNVPPARWPAVMIPTTSGTGSEVTHTAIVSDDGGRKLWAWAPDMAPDTVILDPTLTASVPPGMIVGTGLDAFVHGLEALTGQGANVFTEAYGLAAIRRARGALSTYRRDPYDVHAAADMQFAATLAGLAIDAGGTGMAHNIGHALGSLYHVPHGVAVTVGLQASLGWSIDADISRYHAAADAFGIGDDDTAGLVPAFDDWLAEVDFPALARGVLPASVDAAALAAEMAAEPNRPMIRNNARVAQEDELTMLADRVAACCLDHAATGEVAS